MSTKLDGNPNFFHVFQELIFSKEAKDMGPYTFLIYCTVKAHVDLNDGTAFPGIERIMDLTGLSRAQVFKSLRDLEDRGYLERRKVGRRNEFILRERFNLKTLDGEAAAVATWDYVPRAVALAYKDLKNVLLTGDLNGAKVVMIEHLHLNIATDQAQLVVAHEGASVSNVTRETPKD